VLAGQLVSQSSAAQSPQAKTSQEYNMTTASITSKKQGGAAKFRVRICTEAQASCFEQTSKL
jgi:hypothetical protein